jgi:hypothetical protein
MVSHFTQTVLHNTTLTFNSDGTMILNVFGRTFKTTKTIRGRTHPFVKLTHPLVKVRSKNTFQAMPAKFIMAVLTLSFHTKIGSMVSSSITVMILIQYLVMESTDSLNTKMMMS